MRPPVGDGSITKEIESAISSGILKGAIVLATDSTSNFTYSSALGTRTLLSGETVPQSLDDVLYLASGTKLFAAIAALQCVDDGLLTLTSDLSSIVPELTSKQVFKGWSDATSDPPVPILEPQPLPGNPAITLESLLSQSSGMVYDFIETTGIGKWNAKFNAPEVLPDGSKKPRPVEKAFAYPLSFHPETKWMYGPGFDWAGLIVERLTGRRLRDHIQERIIGPVGGIPSDVEFYPASQNQDLRDRLVDLHPEDPLAVGKQVLISSGEMNLLAQGDFGGHGMFTTGENYLLVLKSLLANDGKILKKETLNTMFENHLTDASRKAQEEAIKSPFGPFFAVGTDEFKMQVGYGLGGLVTMEGVEGWYGKGTMTWGGGQTFVWFVDRENDLCGLCALQAKLPAAEMEKIAELKQVFRRDIYRIREAWRAGGKKD
ncbi:beta-lactamase/transpeptidase-like protein [Rhypophila decipiens]|uniref:Beta-lactamase/transpeptidase-like protein n=1 Tax=Rhypophila decipiens TaxID=261697 RepID=A0AAN6XZW1_9PEZI|nr:beta-lactamase/transpeptidase-like protein [Rhypophila decipiens]